MEANCERVPGPPENASGSGGASSQAGAVLRMGKISGASGAESHESTPPLGELFQLPCGGSGGGPTAELGGRLLGGFLSCAPLCCGSRHQLPKSLLKLGADPLTPRPGSALLRVP